MSVKLFTVLGAAATLFASSTAFADTSAPQPATMSAKNVGMIMQLKRAHNHMNGRSNGFSQGGAFFFAAVGGGALTAGVLGATGNLHHSSN